jgi:hypothetical protein
MEHDTCEELAPLAPNLTGFSCHRLIVPAAARPGVPAQPAAHETLRSMLVSRRGLHHALLRSSFLSSFVLLFPPQFTHCHSCSGHFFVSLALQLSSNLQQGFDRLASASYLFTLDRVLDAATVVYAHLLKLSCCNTSSAYCPRGSSIGGSLPYHHTSTFSRLHQLPTKGHFHLYFPGVPHFFFTHLLYSRVFNQQLLK